ncbi:recombinase family protein [Microbacterium aquimaris]|uniref:recombinase family protein n=1 Tax=Microbacterium aquimaris TaxID=459816 RepID=UPI002AD32976|nr:recombinase family protein [Microbacterium aquimaris]MDZ8276496.1 recombinase family protein [Microbacterium aquimaris]
MSEIADASTTGLSHAPHGDGDDVATETAPLHLPHTAAQCPKCFTELQRDSDWWQARPIGSKLVGLVISRDDMPSVVEQREELTRFGVPIEGFRHPAPETLETWEQRLVRLFGTLTRGDVLVVANVHALGRDIDEETRTVAELHRRGVVVKVLSHGGRHLFAPGR